MTAPKPYREPGPKHPTTLILRIRDLVAEGAYSAQQIADLCQPMSAKPITKNTICGIIYRHKMTGPRIDRARPLRVKVKKERASRAKHPQVIEDDRSQIIHALPVADALPMPEILTPFPIRPVTLFRLKPHHCRWPMDLHSMARAQRFCGVDKVGDGSYCEEHRRMARPR